MIIGNNEYCLFPTMSYNIGAIFMGHPAKLNWIIADIVQRVPKMILQFFNQFQQNMDMFWDTLYN